MKTYGTLFLETRNSLRETEDRESASMMARVLLAQASGMTQAQVLSQLEKEASSEVVSRVERAVYRITDGEPFAYVLGNWEFFGLPLIVTPAVLIPRDDTCAVTSLAMNQALFLGKQPRILDLCCGSGCIGLAIASRVKDARVTLADESKEALNIAKKNVELNHMGGRTSCIRLNALEVPPAFIGKYDMLVSNPPYITGEEMKSLPESVIRYEPEMALYGGEDGLDFYRAIIQNYTDCLNPGGYMAFEFGMGQGDAVCRLLEQAGYSIISRVRDDNDRERAVLAQCGGKE